MKINLKICRSLAVEKFCNLYAAKFQPFYETVKLIALNPYRDLGVTFLTYGLLSL